MKTIAAALALVTLFCSATAAAGVVVEQEEVRTGGMAPSQPHKQTVMVEGHKQKVEMGRTSLIIDLDKGSMTVLDSTDHTYFQSPFPPSGPSSQMMRSFIAQHMNFQKGGGERTIAGYKCRDYTSSGKTPSGEYSATACYSTDAPGAAEFGAFESAMIQKLRGDAAAKAGMPQGVPLTIHTSTKMTSFSIPGMSPEQAKKLNEMMANRPALVSDTTVTKISAQHLSDDAFAVPAGYTKRERPAMHGGMMGGHPPMGHPGGTMAHPPASGETP